MKKILKALHVDNILAFVVGNTVGRLYTYGIVTYYLWTSMAFGLIALASVLMLVELSFQLTLIEKVMGH